MEINTKDIARMERLMKRLRNKKFNTDDQKELKEVASYFLFVAVAISYTDGYSLSITKKSN